MTKSDVLILGGGYAGVYAALGAARARGRAGIEIRMVSGEPDLVNRPRLYETDPGPHMRYPLETLLDRIAVELTVAWVTTIDLEARTVALADGGALAYGRLVIALGSAMHRPAIPGIEHAFDAHPLPSEALERDQTLSFAHVVLLDRLAPVERAAVVLHEALDWSHGEIARALGKSEPACRQILARARRRLAQPPVAAPVGAGRPVAIARRFLAALAQGDVPTLMDTLDAAAVLVSDGGGRVVAALNPIRGRDRVGRLLAGLIAKRYAPMSGRAVPINGEPGLWLEREDGTPYAAISVALTPDAERIAAIYVVRNPDKLRRPPV